LSNKYSFEETKAMFGSV